MSYVDNDIIYEDYEEYFENNSGDYCISYEDYAESRTNEDYLSAYFYA